MTRIQKHGRGYLNFVLRQYSWERFESINPQPRSGQMICSNRETFEFKPAVLCLKTGLESHPSVDGRVG